MTNEEWLEHYGFGCVESGQMTDEQLVELKEMAGNSRPFAPDEYSSDITVEMEARAQRNFEFFRVAVLLVPMLVDELRGLRRSKDGVG